MQRQPVRKLPPLSSVTYASKTCSEFQQATLKQLAKTKFFKMLLSFYTTRTDPKRNLQNSTKIRNTPFDSPSAGEEGEGARQGQPAPGADHSFQ